MRPRLTVKAAVACSASWLFEQGRRLAGRRACPAFLVGLLATTASAADLILELENAADVHFVGAIRRWDADGNPLRPVDPKAAIASPAVDTRGAQVSGGRWILADLKPGRYDLVLLARQRVRIEGFDFPPVLEFDPFFSTTDVPDAAACDWIRQDIAQSRHYENKVAPLFFAGKGEHIRVFVQLLRDQPTSYDREFGEPVATLRHEVWQYTFRYGAWTKEPRTRVLDRVLMAKRELQQWTWVWEPSLGGIQVQGDPVTVRYRVPARFDPREARGLFP